MQRDVEYTSLANLALPALAVATKAEPAGVVSKILTSCAIAFVHRPVCTYQADDDRNGGDFKGRACNGGVKNTGLCALAFVHQPLFIDQVGDARNGGDGKG